MITLAVGTTDTSVDVQILDDDGLPVTGLAAATFPTVKYSKGTGADATITLSDLSALTDAHSDGGVFERGEGVYRLDLVDAVASAIAAKVTIRGEATGKRLICPAIQVGNLPGDVKAWKGSVPASLADTDKVPTSTQHMANGVITAAAIATDAIDADALATDAIAEINATVDTALADYDGPTLAELIAEINDVQTDIAALNDLSAAQVNAEVDQALVDAGVTTTRTGYLDKLNISGNVASSAEVTSIQNNTRVVRVVPPVIERPDSGTTTYRIELLLYDDVGNMEAPDSAPTIALVDQGGTDLSARLDSATMALVSTGRYRAIYTATDTDDLEQLVWTFSVVEGGATRLYGNTSLIVDTTAADFTSADRTKLDTLAADYTSARAAKLDNLDATVSSRATPAQVNAEADTALADIGATSTVMGRIDVAISTRLATAGYTAPDNAGISTAATNTATILSRIGAFAGSGINTILGFFQALFRSDASAPSDVGGTFDPATDSVEAIRNNMGVAQTGDSFVITSSGTFGNSALKTLIDTVKAKTDLIPASPAAVGSAMTLTSAYDFAKGTVQMAESYSANGVAPTPVQALFGIQQYLMTFGISGVNYTVKKLDGSTTAFVVTLNDAATPTAATRS